MLLGIGLNAVLWIISSTRGQPQVISIVVSPAAHDWVYFGLLPPIIFEAGFSMRKRGFFDNLVPILLYAVVGTLVATLAASAMLYACVTIGWIKGSITLGHCLLFAALISPTDPVATLSVLREVRAPPMLRNCIFGEATLNDALSLVFFHIVRKHYHRLEAGNGLVSTASDTLIDLTWAATGSLLVGCALGLGCAFATQQLRRLRRAAGTRSGHADQADDGRGGSGHSEDVPHAELALLATVALLTFTASEQLGFSGIFSLFVCGTLTRHYTYHNLSDAAQAAVTTFFATLSMICENGLATMLGVAAFDYGVVAKVEASHLPLAALTLPIIFISRALNIFPLSLIANCLRKRTGKYAKVPIGWRMQVIMWFSGMRGALSFAMAIALDDDRYPHPVPPAIYHTLLYATLSTIVATTLLMAPATRPLIQLLDLRAADGAGGGTLLGLLCSPNDGASVDSNLSSLSLSLLGNAPADTPSTSSTLRARMITPSPPPRRVLRHPSALPPSSAVELASAPEPSSPTVLSSDENDAEQRALPSHDVGTSPGMSPGLHSLYRYFRQLELLHLKPIFGGRLREV